MLSAAIGIPWFVGAIQIDGPAMFRSLFGCAVAAVVIDVVLHQLEARLSFPYALEVGHGQKILWLGVMWHLLGGIHNPMLLVMFFLPLLTTAVLLMRREALLTACVSAIVGNVVALMEAPELRWYLGQVGFPLASPLSLLSQEGLSRGTPFVGIETGPEFQFVVLLVFTSCLVGAAVISSAMTTRVLGLMERIRFAAASLDEPRELFRAALRENPIPTVLVFPDSGQIVEASRSFTNQMLLDRGTLAGRTLFDCLTFTDPQSMHSLLMRQSGELPFTGYRIGAEARTACVRCFHIRFLKTEFAVVSVQDVNELSYLMQVSDSFVDPILILRGRRDIVYFNGAARQLCPGLHFGMDAIGMLDAPNSELWGTDNDEPAVAATIQKRAFMMETLHVWENAGDETLKVVRLRALDPTHFHVPTQEARAS